MPDRGPVHGGVLCREGVSEAQGGLFIRHLHFKDLLVAFELLSPVQPLTSPCMKLCGELAECSAWSTSSVRSGRSLDPLLCLSSTPPSLPVLPILSTPSSSQGSPGNNEPSVGFVSAGLPGTVCYRTDRRCPLLSSQPRDRTGCLRTMASIRYKTAPCRGDGPISRFQLLPG